MIKYLVIGDPVSHSRSPGMQNAAFESCGLGSPYGIRHVKPEELPAFFEDARKKFLGVNLTVPHKLMAVELADGLTERARICQSVNTLLIKDEYILGDSTDGTGLEMALKHNFGMDVSGKHLLFAGAGGAARATAVHLAASGAASITFANRTPSRAHEIISLIENSKVQCKCSFVQPSDSEGMAEAIRNTDCLIQATSLGLKEDDPPPFDLGLLHSGMKLKIFDTIYRETLLQKRAAELGIPVAGGKEMLVHQGAASFEWWTKLPAPLDEMRKGFELPPGGIEV